MKTYIPTLTFPSGLRERGGRGQARRVFLVCGPCLSRATGVRKHLEEHESVLRTSHNTMPYHTGGYDCTLASAGCLKRAVRTRATFIRACLESVKRVSLAYRLRFLNGRGS